MVLNTCGVLHDPTTNQMPEKSITQIDPDWMMRNYLINTIGPTMVMKYFGPIMFQDKNKEMF